MTVAVHEQARQAQLGDNMASLLVELEEAVSVNRLKRDVAREADGTAREAKRKLGALTAQRCVPWEFLPLSIVSPAWSLVRERARKLKEFVHGHIPSPKNNIS